MTTHAVCVSDEVMSSMGRIAEMHGVDPQDVSALNFDLLDTTGRRATLDSSLEPGQGVLLPDNVLRDEPVEHIVERCRREPEFDLVFVPHCPSIGLPDESFLLFTDEALLELAEEEDFWSGLQRDLGKANAGGDEAEVFTAKENLGRHLAEVVRGQGTNELTQIHRLRGNKATWVRSQKLKNHFRRYRLDSDDAKRSLRTKDGRLDRKKLIDQFANVELKVRAAYASELHKFHQDALPERWAEIVDGWEESLSWSRDVDGVPEDEVRFDVSTDAQLLRYFWAAEAAATFDPLNGRIGLRGHVEGQFAFCQGGFRATGYLPSKAGHRFSTRALGKDGQWRDFDVGAFRAQATLEASGFVGASISGTAALEADIALESGRIRVRGADKPTTKKEKDAPFATSVSGQVFAGAKLGGDLSGSVEWDNPEHRTEPNIGLPDEAAIRNWKPLFTLGAGVAGAAGIGAEGDVVLSWENGRFMFRCRAGLVYGVGGSGSVSGVVEAWQVSELMQYVYCKLRDENFSFLGFVAEGAFKTLSLLQPWMIATRIDSLEDVRTAIYLASDWLGTRADVRENAEQLSEAINSGQSLLRFTTPEAKGAMLHLLSERFWWSAEEAQERAIIEVLRWVQSKNELRNLLERITPDGLPTPGLNRGDAQNRGLARLNSVLDGAMQHEFNQLRLLLHVRSMRTGEGQLSRRHGSEDALVDVYPDVAVPDVAVRPVTEGVEP